MRTPQKRILSFHVCDNFDKVGNVRIPYNNEVITKFPNNNKVESKRFSPGPRGSIQTKRAASGG